MLLGSDELLFVGVVRDGDIFDLFAFRQFREVNIDGFGHRRDRRGRSHGFDLDADIDRSTQRAFAESGDCGQLLGGEAFENGLDVRWLIEGQQIEFLDVQIVQVGGDCAGQNHRREL